MTTARLDRRLADLEHARAAREAALDAEIQARLDDALAAGELVFDGVRYSGCTPNLQLVADMLNGAYSRMTADVTGPRGRTCDPLTDRHDGRKEQ